MTLTLDAESLGDLTGRERPEWIATHPGQDIPKAVKLRIFRRYKGRCYKTGIPLKPGQYDFDHVKPLAMGGQHREGNLAPIWRPAHREKTADEAGDRAKADRIYAKHHGLQSKSKRPLQSRGFEKTRRMD